MWRGVIYRHLSSVTRRSAISGHSGGIITMVVAEATPASLHRSSLMARGEYRGTGGKIITGLQQQNGDEMQSFDLEADMEEGGTLLAGRAAPLKGAVAYRIVYMCVSGAAFVNGMTFSILGPFLPEYVSTRFGSSSTQVGLIMAMYPAVNLITSPMVSSIMNRYGRLNALLMGLVTLAAATALYGAAGSVFWMFFASGLHGTSLSLIHISSLALLSAFPDRITEGMGGIEVWSGVALVIGPPLGGLAHPLGGVSSVFMLMSIFPLMMLLFAPRIRRQIRSAKHDLGELGPTKAVSFWKVARSRGVLVGAFVTAYNYGMNGLLEATLSPHLAQTLSTSPSSIGFVFILPNILYTIMAAKAEDIVDRVGVKKTLLWGLGIMAVSLLLLGPSPALSPMLMTRAAAKGSIGLGLLVFQVGSAMATVPAFTVMQASVANMGKGGDNTVASVHSLSIGVGEVIGPVLGGMMMEMLPRSPAMACEPGVWMIEAVDSAVILQGAGLVVADSKGGKGENGHEKSEEQHSEGKTPTTGKRKAGVAVTAEEEGSENLGKVDGDVAEDIEEKVVIGRDKSKPGRVLAREDGEESKAIAVGRKRRLGDSDRGEGHEKVVQDGGRESVERKRVLDGVNNDKLAARVDGEGRNRVSKELPEFSARGAAGDVPQPPAIDVRLIDDAQAKIVGKYNVEEQSGESEERDGGGVGGSVEGDGMTSDSTAESCDSSFPLAITLAAWVSLFSVIVAYQMYPSGRDRADVSSSLLGGNSGVETV